MSKRDRIIPNLKELWEDMKGMTFREKLDHLWTYYKEYLAMAAVLCLCVVACVAAYQNATKNIVCTSVYANVTMTPTGMYHLKDGFAKELGVDQKNDVVEVTTVNFSSLADPTSSENNYETAQLLTALVTAGRMDYALMDKMAMEFYIYQDVFLDLSEFFTAEELAELREQDMLVYYQAKYEDNYGNILDDLTEEPFPIAVKIQSTPFCQAEMHGKEVYFAIGGNNPKLDKVRMVWDKLVNYGK